MNIPRLRKRRGIAAVVTSAIMMSAVAILGSTGIVWSQTTLTSQQVEMTNTVDNYTNKLNESFNFEYVYCNDDPCETIIVIITNTGKVTLDISTISISDKYSGFEKIHPISNGEIKPDSSISIPINDPSFSTHIILDVMSTTNRGNVIQTQIST